MNINLISSKGEPASEETLVRPIDMKAGRRAFIQSLGLGVAGAAMLGAGGVQPAAAQAAITDGDILNFALNLEYLEAEFYLRAISGQGLSDSEISAGSAAPGPGSTTPGAVIGGRQVRFATRSIQNYAREIATEERIHVQFLRTALGNYRVARPRIDLVNSFTAAARAAGLISSTASFDAFANEVNFLLASYIFEDVGVTAYLGAARFIQNKDTLTAAGGILAAEAYHAGTIRTVLYAQGQYTAAQKISDARDSLDGSSDMDQGIGSATFANTSLTNPANGTTYARTTDQVLQIVYLNTAGRDGGFLPAGVNGKIQHSRAT